MDKIESGAYGDIYKAHRKADSPKTTLALKVVTFEQLAIKEGKMGLNKEARGGATVFEEIKALKRMKGRSEIIQLYEAFAVSKI